MQRRLVDGLLVEHGIGAAGNLEAPVGIESFILEESVLAPWCQTQDEGKEQARGEQRDGHGDGGLAG